MLSTPSAWLSHALLTFQAALLSFAWLSDIVAVQIVITILIGLRFTLGFAMLISFVGVEEAFLGLLGACKDLNHNTIIATEGKVCHWIHTGVGSGKPCRSYQKAGGYQKVAKCR